jgi:hypothetical protein
MRFIVRRRGHTKVRVDLPIAAFTPTARCRLLRRPRIEQIAHNRLDRISVSAREFGRDAGSVAYSR